MYILSSDENVGGSHQALHLCRWSIISTQLLPAVFFVANLGILSDVRRLWLMTTGSIQESKRYLRT